MAWANYFVFCIRYPVWHAHLLSSRLNKMVVLCKNRHCYLQTLMQNFFKPQGYSTYLPWCCLGRDCQWSLSHEMVLILFCILKNIIKAHTESIRIRLSALPCRVDYLSPQFQWSMHLVTATRIPFLPLTNYSFLWVSLFDGIRPASNVALLLRGNLNEMDLAVAQQ